MFKPISNKERAQQLKSVERLECTECSDLNGFEDTFLSVLERLTIINNTEKIIHLKRIDTVLGSMVVCSDDKGICLLEFLDKKKLPNELNKVSRVFNANIVQGESSHIVTLEKELKEYFEGKRTSFTVPVSMIGTEFQKQVWQILRQIPYGSTMSYQQQAIIVGNPKSVRAVANANGSNIISIVIPCHRVIGSNGRLTGYSGGIWRKQKLLNLENQQIDL